MGARQLAHLQIPRWTCPAPVETSVQRFDRWSERTRAKLLEAWVTSSSTVIWRGACTGRRAVPDLANSWALRTMNRTSGRQVHDLGYTAGSSPTFLPAPVRDLLGRRADVQCRGRSLGYQEGQEPCLVWWGLAVDAVAVHGGVPTPQG